MTTSLQGARILVIGGAKHLGLAIARRLDDAGAEVVIGARDLTAAQAAASTLTLARGIAIDITAEESIAAAAAELGGVDHIISTAAAHHNVPVIDLDHDSVITAFEAKVIGPLMVAKHFAPQMNPHGSLMFFSGVAAWKPAPGYAIMGITNGALDFAIRHLANELAPIRVGAISPGIIDSGMWDSMGDADRSEYFDEVAGGLPVQRVGATTDIVDAVQWLLTAGFVSGETPHVEGGARSA